jgi:hypothetical protein
MDAKNGRAALTARHEGDSDGHRCQAAPSSGSVDIEMEVECFVDAGVSLGPRSMVDQARLP